MWRTGTIYIRTLWRTGAILEIWGGQVLFWTTIRTEKISKLWGGKVLFVFILRKYYIVSMRSTVIILELWGGQVWSRNYEDWGGLVIYWNWMRTLKSLRGKTSSFFWNAILRHKFSPIYGITLLCNFSNSRNSKLRTTLNGNSSS